MKTNKIFKVLSLILALAMILTVAGCAGAPAEESKPATETSTATPAESTATEDAAEEMSKQLGAKGVETEIVRAGDIYKVIGRISGDREEALSALEEIKNKEITDVFIASFQ